MKISKMLISNIKNISGNVLAIGDFNPDILNAIKNNTNIIECNILSNNMEFTDGKKAKKGKRVQLNNLKKSFKKKKINYLICDYDKLNDYLKTFVRDSIYITKDYIYFCTDDVDKLIKKYSRYNTKIEVRECSDKKILIINTKYAKNNKIKEKIYYIIDTIYELIDVITNMLVS